MRTGNKILLDKGISYYYLKNLQQKEKSHK